MAKSPPTEIQVMKGGINGLAGQTIWMSAWCAFRKDSLFRV